MPRRPAEKFFVDLLPTSWSGQPPGLPPEVVADLARRAREADRLERKERQAVAQQRATAAPVRVHVATQPTFTRYIFAVPAKTAVSADRVKERLTLTFDAPIKFDLADVVAALPRAIGGIDAELSDDSALVRFSFLANVDIRTFRDDGSYVLDVVGADNKPDEASAAPAAPATPQQSAAPETTGARNSPARGGERRCRAQRRGAGSAGKTRRRATGNIAAPDATGSAAARHRPLRRKPPPPSPADKPAATPKAEAQIAAPRNAAAAGAFSRYGKGGVPRCRQLRRHRNRDAAARARQSPANAAPPPRPRAANSSGKVAVELSPPRRQSETVVPVHDADGGGGVQSRRHAVDRVRFQGRYRSQRARRRGEPHHSRRRIHPHAPTPTSCGSSSIVRIWPRVDIDGPTWTVQIGDTVIDTDARARHHPQSDRPQSVERHHPVRQRRIWCTGSTIPTSATRSSSSPRSRRRAASSTSRISSSSTRWPRPRASWSIRSPTTSRSSWLPTRSSSAVPWA